MTEREESLKRLNRSTTGTQTFISVTSTAVWAILMSILDKRFGVTLPEDVSIAVYSAFSVWIAWAIRRAVSKAGLQVAIVLLAAAMPFMPGCAASFPKENCTLGEVPGPYQKYFNEDRAWLCNCEIVPITIDPHPNGEPKPAGVVLFKCDDKILPVVIATGDVGVPACQP